MLIQRVVEISSVLTIIAAFWARFFSSDNGMGSLLVRLVFVFLLLSDLWIYIEIAKIKKAIQNKSKEESEKEELLQV